MQGLVVIEIDNRCARIWRAMLESGALDTKGGNVVLSFDKGGELKAVKRELFFTPSVHNSSIFNPDPG